MAIRISASFLDLPYVEDASLDSFAAYFKPKHANCWGDKANSGHFKFENGSGGSVILFFARYSESEISLRYDFNIPSVRGGLCWYSVGNTDKLDTLVDADTDLYIPLGSCLTPTIAFKVIEDFFRNPLIKSEIVEWVNADHLDWAAVY